MSTGVMRKAQRLRAGDTVAAISLSWGGPGTFPQRYEIGKTQLEDAFGVRVVPTRHALRDATWLSNNPQARADDLMEAFADSAIRGIVSTIGGDDSLRIIRHVDPAVIAANPKVFLGYSDTTVSHLLCYKAGLVTFYGPAIMAGFAENGGPFSYMVDSVRASCFSSSPIGRIAPNADGWTVERIPWADRANQQRKRQLTPSTGWKFLQGSGVRIGRLFGGCLEVLEWLRGTPVWPDVDALRGAMLFLETSEEAPPPSSISRALRSFAAMGILRHLSGILFARPGGAVPPERFAEYDRAILRVVAEEEGLSSLPIITNMDFGHTDPMFVVPYGVAARIDCDREEFEVTESAVVD